MGVATCPHDRLCRSTASASPTRLCLLNWDIIAVAYPDHFLDALGAWQNGWREQADRRAKITETLLASIENSSLPKEALSVDGYCYRKRFLVANNPQNGGDMLPLFGYGRLNDGVASWTTNQTFAQDFKDPIRTGTISVIFRHAPQPHEIVLNIEALWGLDDFQAAVSAYKDRKGANAGALMHFRSRQSEVILEAPLLRDEIIGFCGKSSPFETLCELAGLTSEEDQDQFWSALEDANAFPEEPFWLSPEGVRNVIERVRRRYGI